MDPISYSKASQQEQRIKKFVAQPDSVAGLVSVPNLVPTGETITIPTGRTVVHPSLQVDGMLDVQGTLFIPSGGSVSTTEVDATVVKQNGNVVANDSTVVHKTGDETIAGVKTFSSSPLLPVPTLANQAISMGNIIEKTSAGLGYGTGSGGTVTQLTSKATAVTLNKPCGKVTMHNSSLSSFTDVSFELYNSFISNNYTVLINGSADAVSAASYVFTVKFVGNGYCVIMLKNIAGTALSDNPIFNFAIIKGATA